MDVDAMVQEVKQINLTGDHQAVCDASSPEARLVAHSAPPFNGVQTFLKTHSAVIAGSAVVKALMPSTWEPSDIDIFYTAGRQGESLLKELVSLGWVATSLTGSTYQWCIPHRILEAREMTHSGMRISVVCMCHSPESLIDTLRSAFDFDSVAVCYDGERIHMNPRMKEEDFYGGLWTYNIQGLIYAMGIVDHRHHIVVPAGVFRFFTHVRSRLDKYAKRGVRIVNGYAILLYINRARLKT